MEPTSSAASSNAEDIEALLGEVLYSSLLDQPEQGLVPAARPAVHLPRFPPRELFAPSVARPLPPIPYQLGAQQQLQQQHALVPPFLPCSPRFDLPAAPFQLVSAPSLSNLNASARDYSPVANFTPSTPTSSIRPRLPHPGAAAASSTRNVIDVQAFLPNPIGPSALLSPVSSERVVHLLEEGGEEVRLTVLAAVVSGNVHEVMGTGHAVFVALLRACDGRFEELEGIVKAVCRGMGFLKIILTYEHGMAALKGLISVVAPWSELSAIIIRGVLVDGLMEETQGPQLIRHCFTRMAYQDYSVIIRYAITCIDTIRCSPSGWRCLAECFANARDGELGALQGIILSRTREIAMGPSSNYFLQRVLECGSERFRERIADRLLEDIVSFTADQHGRFVVRACFIRPVSPPLLQRALAVFKDLTDGQLAGLLDGVTRFPNFVFRDLLKIGKTHFPRQAFPLARRIQNLRERI